MNRYASDKDLTAKQHHGGGGMSHFRLHLCGHKGSTTGATYSKRLGAFIRCPACTAKGKA